MAENGSSNTAIVAILVIVLLVLGLGYFFGFFSPQQGGSTKIIEKPTTIIEKPATK